MNNTVKAKLLILIVIFLGTTALVYGMKQPGANKGKIALNEQLINIPGYSIIRKIALNKDALQMLKLDDYLFADYQGPDGKVNLYIGYYYTAAKAYASHSPLICYPSQGWKIDSGPSAGTLNIPPTTIHYEEITTSQGDKKELVLFWYQSRLQTATQIYKNKINMGYNKLVHNDQQHGFVRVAVPFADSTYTKAKNMATTFIRAFYPKFTKYILTSDQGWLCPQPNKS